eukprot:SAG22_NODE_2406_length_2606_cov_1.556841_1_plen_124_part_10
MHAHWHGAGAMAAARVAGLRMGLLLACCAVLLCQRLRGCLAAAGGPAAGTVALPAAPCQAEGAPPPPLPRGVVSVVEHYGADPTGKADSTAALQAAAVDAVSKNLTLFVPLGCYTVTDTVTAAQ